MDLALDLLAMSCASRVRSRPSAR